MEKLLHAKNGEVKTLKGDKLPKTGRLAPAAQLCLRCGLKCISSFGPSFPHL